MKDIYLPQTDDEAEEEERWANEQALWAMADEIERILGPTIVSGRFSQHEKETIRLGEFGLLILTVGPFGTWPYTLTNGDEGLMGALQAMLPEGAAIIIAEQARAFYNGL